MFNEAYFQEVFLGIYATTVIITKQRKQVLIFETNSFLRYQCLNSTEHFHSVCSGIVCQPKQDWRRERWQEECTGGRRELRVERATLKMSKRKKQVKVDLYGFGNRGSDISFSSDRNRGKKEGMHRRRRCLSLLCTFWIFTRNFEENVKEKGRVKTDEKRSMFSDDFTPVQFK